MSRKKRLQCEIDYTGKSEMKQAIAYLRKSTDMQETSLEQQKKDILVFADANEIEVIRFFEEEACGENTEGRPQFRTMIEFCKVSREPFQYVLVPDISRWGRFQDPTETFYWIHEVKRYHKEVIFVNEGFKNDDIGTSLMKLIKSSEASEYLKKIRQNTIRGMRFHASRGYWMGGKAPYGYERMIVETGQVLKDGEHKNIKDQKIKLIISKKEARLIKLIYILYGEKGLSDNSIVNYLNENAIPAPNGRKWSKSTIWSILHNQVYIGNTIYNIRNYHRRNGESKFNPKKDWIITPDTHQAIIVKELWNKVQARTSQAFLGGRFLTKKDKPQSSYLLSSIMYCEVCKSKWQGRRYHLKDRVRRIYVCGGYHAYGSKSCVSWQIDADKLENKIISYIMEKLDTGTWREDLESKIREKISLMQDKSDDRLRELDIQIKELALKIRHWEEAIERGLNIDRAVANINKLEHTRDTLLDERIKITTSLEGETNIERITKKMMGYLDNFKDVLEHGAMEEKKKFIKQFVKEIKVNPRERTAKIMIYKDAMYDIITGVKNCKDLMEINYP